LGTRISSKCDEETELDMRLSKANKCAGMMNHLLRAKDLAISTRMRIYQTIIRPTILYGAETWILNRKVQEKLLRWERKIIRRILGGKKTEEGYVRRTNNEIYEIYKAPTIDQVVKARRLQWLGHIERMPEERIVKRIESKAPEYKKRRGRPRKRWKQSVLENLKEKKIEDWRNKALNRKTWRNITKLWA